MASTKSKVKLPGCFAWFKCRARVLSAFLLAIFLVGLLPVEYEAADATRTSEDAYDLMVAARGILVEDDIDDGEDIAGGSRVFLIRADVPPGSPADQILVRLINATKKQLGDLEQACKEMRGSFSEGEKDCEEKLAKAYCDEQIAKLRARLFFLRKVRGDRRKRLTRVWHAIKRAGARIWQKVGPLGRRFLRNLGQEALSIVKSGGSLHGGVLRRLVIKHARTVIRREGRRILKRVAQRVIVGRAETGDDCGGLADESSEEGLEAIKYEGEDWFEEVWGDMQELLKAEGRFCQRTAVNNLGSCLYQKSNERVSAEEGIKACESLYKAIPKNDAGGSVSLQGVTYYGDADPNQVNITYPSVGGSVTGDVHFVRHSDVFGCTYTLKATLSGEYDPDTCKMSGTTDIEMLYEGDVCVSVCGSAPDSPTSCPETFNRTWGWEATLEDGVLRGNIVGENVDRGHFDFRVPAADG
jgi:hypothetical protein